MREAQAETSMLSYLGGYGYILLTLTLTVYGQLILKWRLSQLGPLPEGLYDKVRFLVVLIFDPFVFSVYIAVFAAGLSWMAALSRFDLNYAYPFMSLSFVFVLLLSSLLLGEPLTWGRSLGVALIVAGTIVASRG
jgi:drug/metabolite transporter (DMT)-like permease